MPASHVSIHVFEEFETRVSEQWIKHAATLALEAAIPHSEEAVNVVIADDEVVQRLNRQYRGLDERTDVLSFSYTHQGHYYGETSRPTRADDSEFVMPEGVGSPPGEVIVSYPQAARQAESAGHTVETELAFLVVHGVLHLLGHDHESPDERATMEGLQDRVLQAIPRPGR